jgi:hypothetical protein
MGKIEMIIKKKFGKNSSTFVVGGDTFHDAVLEASKLSFGDVEKCGICASDDLFLGAHETKGEGFLFAYVRCSKCRATLNFGQQKKADVVYLRTKEDKKTLDWMKFEPNVNE